MKEIYLDNAATTAVEPDVFKAMEPYLKERFGNPSTPYKIGRQVHEELEEAREKIASLFNATKKEIVFTSCGSESNNQAIKGIADANKKKGNHIITSVVEHHAVLETCKFLEKKGYEITYLPVDKEGFVLVEDVKKAIKKETILISIMLANNEVGTIEPVAKIGNIAKENGIYMHTDAVQVVGVAPINVDELNVDLLSISAHKFYGPKGVGMLYLRKGTKITPLIHGGHQENRKRAGTENVAGIIGMAKAMEIAINGIDENNNKISKLRDKLIEGLLSNIDYTFLNGPKDKRLPNNANIGFQYIEGESILLNLEQKGIYASTGSACSSDTLDPSHVLIAVGLPHEKAHGCIRMSLSKHTTEVDIDTVIKEFPPIIEKLRAMSPLYEKVR